MTLATDWELEDMNQGDLGKFTLFNTNTLRNVNMTFGVVSKDVAGSSDVTLSKDEQRHKVIILTGTLTGSINVNFSDLEGVWLVYNNTSGAFTVTVKTVSGTGATVTQGNHAIAYSDGTNMTVVGL